VPNTSQNAGFVHAQHLVRSIKPTTRLRKRLVNNKRQPHQRVCGVHSIGGCSAKPNTSRSGKNSMAALESQRLLHLISAALWRKPSAHCSRKFCVGCCTSFQAALLTAAALESLASAALRSQCFRNLASAALEAKYRLLHAALESSGCLRLSASSAR
jgi:hypothetical protein